MKLIFDLKKALGKNISQRSLSRKLGLHPTTINKITKNKSLPSLPIAFVIAQYFQKPVECIWELSDNEKEQFGVSNLERFRRLKIENPYGKEKNEK